MRFCVMLRSPRGHHSCTVGAAGFRCHRPCLPIGMRHAACERGSGPPGATEVQMVPLPGVRVDWPGPVRRLYRGIRQDLVYGISDTLTLPAGAGVATGASAKPVSLGTGLIARRHGKRRSSGRLSITAGPEAPGILRRCLCPGLYFSTSGCATHTAPSNASVHIDRVL